MQNRTTQRLTYIFGISMAVLMAVTLFLPALVPDTTMQQLPVPTATPIPVATFPPPLNDFSSIVFNEDYLHPSGLFAVGVPTGWSPNAPVNNPNQAQITFGNPDTVSLIETYLIDPPEPIESLEAVSARFDEANLRASWNQYSTSNELSRRIDTENNRVLIDFELSRSQQQFLARHAAWTDGDWIYVARVVVPQNARDLMFFLLDEVVDNFQPLTQFQGTVLGWPAYYDVEATHILRHPTTWQQTGGGGAVATFVDEDGTLIQITTQPDLIEDETAAAAWVEGIRSSIEVQNVKTTTRTGGEGFVISYTFTDPDGESLSGQAVLLNGEDDQLHTITALLPYGGVDLNDENDPASFNPTTTALSTFSLLSGLRLPQPETLPQGLTTTTQ